MVAWTDYKSVCYTLLLKDAIFLSESFINGQDRGNFMKWKRAAVYARRFTQTAGPVKLNNPVTHLMTQARDSQSSHLMVVFSRWQIFSWIRSLGKVGYQKVGV